MADGTLKEAASSRDVLGERNKGTRPHMNASAYQIILLLLASYFLFFFRMGAHDLWSPDEPRYAQVAHEMLVSGDWVVPHLNGEIYTEKPPLYFWLVALAARPFGDVSEVTARLPSAIAATLAVLLTYLLGCKMLDRRAAFTGALVMATTAQFFWIGRIAVLDMLLALCILASVCLFYLGYAGRKTILYFLGSLFFAPAALSKGPVGIAVPLVVMFAFLLGEILLHREGSKKQLALFLMWALAGLIVSVLILVPWWQAAYERSGGVYGSLSILTKQTEGRMFESYSHRQPIYYYFVNILWQLAPWTVFLPLVLYTLWKRARLRESLGLRYAAIWFASIFIFFTLISGKRSQYVLPLFPAAGLIFGWALNSWNIREGRLKDRREFSIPLLLLVILSAAGLVGAVIGFYFYARGYLWAVLALAVVSPAGLVVLPRRLQNRPPSTALAWLVVVTVLVTAVLFGGLAPVIDKYKSARPFCADVAAAVGDGDHLFFYRVYRPNINYYMRRSMPRLDSSEEVQNALENSSRIFLVLESRRISSLDLGDAYQMERITRDQIGSRDMVCLVVRRTKKFP